LGFRLPLFKTSLLTPCNQAKQGNDTSKGSFPARLQSIADKSTNNTAGKSTNNTAGKK
jgi:hypothetical protein